MILSHGSRVRVARSPWLSRFSICMWPCDSMIKGLTFIQIRYYSSRSCRVLLQGVVPCLPLVGPAFPLGCVQVRAKRKPVAGRYTFALSDLKGDMALLVTLMGWRSHSATACCSICVASKGDRELHFRNCRSDAGWRATIEDDDLWATSSDQKFRNPIIDIRCFRTERIMNDSMHSGHLRAYMHVSGSVLIDLVDMAAFDDRDRQERLDGAWGIIQTPVQTRRNELLHGPCCS